MRSPVVQIAAASSVFLAAMIGCGPVASGARISATMAADGSILIAERMRVPPYPVEGSWTEFEKKSAEPYEVRHFNYMVPGSAPAIELYLSEAKGDDAPDGAFEMRLVKGYVKGFPSKNGFVAEEPVFDQRTIGGIRVQHTLAKMTNGRRTLWVSAYIFIRKTSLTFLAVRAQEGGEAGVEEFLIGVELR
jgi:hypothetical protein